MIPKIIHYVWVGGPMPQKQQAFIASWRETNPDYQLMLWNEDNIDLRIPLLAAAYDARQWATVADIVRLMAVYEHGGIYLDTDFRLFRPLDPLLQHRCFFAFQEVHRSRDWVANGVFGAVPRHWFVQKAQTRLLAIRRAPFGLERPTKYGPKLITSLLMGHGLCEYSPEGVAIRDVFICPAQVFFPFHWREEYSEACIRPDTIGAHFWEKSWEKTMPAPLQMVRKLRNALRGRRHRSGHIKIGGSAPAKGMPLRSQ